MKRLLLRLSVIAVLFLSVTALQGQDITGIWRGYFVDTSGYAPQQYRFEVQINQSNSGILNGVTYSYSQKDFYGKAEFTGNFLSRSGNTLVQEMRTVEVKGADQSSVCIMKCQLKLVKSGNEQFLEGVFSSAYEYTGYGHAKGDSAGGGRVYLRKVKTSDFYIEPSLRAKIEQKDNPPVVKNNNPPPNKTVAKKPAVRNNTSQNNTKSNSNNKNNATNLTRTTQKPKPEISPVIPEEKNEVAKKPETKIIEKPVVPTPPELKKRTNELVRTIIVNTKEITVKIYDNGEIDDDTISVYLDKKNVLSHQRLTTAPLIVKIKLDESDPDHELVMVADNMGRIPPNTSLMIVDAGKDRYEVRITSTDQKNAVVRFKYEDPRPPLPLP
ncbi:MAG: hypothetical protein GC171_06525 [Terrimonas sp.]|nr:hypothetical protein [Terrimonas sp.]